MVKKDSEEYIEGSKVKLIHNPSYLFHGNHNGDSYLLSFRYNCPDVTSSL